MNPSSRRNRHRPNDSPELLISLRSTEELNRVLQANIEVGVLDFKEPLNGAMGRPAIDQLEAIAAIIRHHFANTPRKNWRMQTSVAVGELADFDQLSDSEWGQLRHLLETFDYVKVGLAKTSGSNQQREAQQKNLKRFRQMLGKCNLILVAYADDSNAESPALESIVAHAIEQDCAGVLVDTFQKRSGTNLFSHVSIEQLAWISRRLHTHNRLFAVAGSLSARDLPRAMACAPDFIGMRGGICHGSRIQTIDVDRIRQVTSELARRKSMPMGFKVS